jgi:hypothetical protein
MDVRGPWLRFGGENLRLLHTHTLLVDINVF